MVVVLFDLEGTLVQSIETNTEAVSAFRRKTREQLEALGIPSRVLDGLSRSTLMINSALQYVEHHFVKNELERFYRALDAFLESYQLRWAESSRLFTDTLPTLTTLERLGYKMGIVTNTSRDAAKRILTLHGIRSFFDVVVTREDVKRLKPDPEGIHLALDTWDAQPFVFVGDLIHDAIATKHADGISVIVNRNPVKKLQFHADYIIRSLQELPQLIHTL